MSRLPDGQLNTDNPDIVLAILAGENPRRCCNEGCRHWGRFVSDKERHGQLETFWCECCAQAVASSYSNLGLPGDFMCDGTRR